MSKHVLVLSTSLRAGSNSERLANAFAAGARAAGHTVDQLSLRGKDLQYCIGCLSCQQTHRCVLRDDAAPLLEKLRRADAVAFATPIYYYGMSGQMKTLLDRTNPLFETDYAFRQVYLLTAAADQGEQVPQKTLTGLQGWLDCFDKAVLVGSVFAGGVTAPDEINGHPSLEEAYRLGTEL